MAVKTYKAMTNGTRGMSKLVNDEITKTTPEFQHKQRNCQAK